MIKAIGQNGLKFIANKFKELKALVDKKANVEDIKASKIIEAYELQENFWDALDNNQDFLNAIQRDMITAVHYKQDLASSLSEKSGLEVALYYKGIPLGFTPVSAVFLDELKQKIKDSSMPDNMLQVTVGFLSKYNNVIQQQLKDIDSKAVQLEPIPLSKLQSFYDGSSGTM